MDWAWELEVNHQQRAAAGFFSHRRPVRQCHWPDVLERGDPCLLIGRMADDSHFLATGLVQARGARHGWIW